MGNHYKDRLKEIVGEDNYFEEYEDLICYSYDATHLTGKIPSITLYPSNTYQVSEIMKIAYEEGIPVIPRGAGSGIAGSYVPMVDNAIIVDLRKMNKIIEIDRENLTATVEAGVVTLDFQTEVEKHGLLYPPDPASQKISTIGGNVATNAGGPRGAKYGNTLAYVLGLEVVLADGRILKTGSKCIKQSSGYNLTKMFVGSEGTLGIITKVTVRLIPKPESKRTMLAIFDRVEDASRAVSNIVAKRMVPATLELMDNKMIKLIDQFKPTSFPLDAEAILIIEVEGEEVVVDKQLDVIRQICSEVNARFFKVAENAKQADEIWEARRSAYGVASRAKPSCLVEDVTVPRTKFPEIIKKIKEISEKYKVDTVILAHAGDGNTHPLILTDSKDEEEMKRVKKALEEIALEGIRLGGTLSGEHGIGVLKKDWMLQEHGEIGLSVMQSIKKALDPKGILNPGKLWNSSQIFK
jgi:glycolate oxidase